MLISVLLALLSFIIVLVAVPPVKSLALRKGFVDRPGGRKLHEELVPPVGGLVIVPVFLLLSVFAGMPWPQGLWIAMAVLLLLITGAVDDFREIHSGFRFFVQFLAAFLVVIPGDVELHNLGNLLGYGDIALGRMSAVFTIISIVLLINAINLLDGLDGLAGGMVFTALFWMALCAGLGGLSSEFGVCLILMGGLAGFLFYNMRHPWRLRASVFLGDAGSLSLGLILGWLCIHIAQQPESGIRPIAVAWVLAVPIMDICAQFGRRVSQGRHPFDADFHHFHHHFIHSGIAVGRATFFIVILGFFSGVIGVLGTFSGIPDPVLSYVWIFLLLAHIYLSLRPHRIRRIIAKFRR